MLNDSQSGHPDCYFHLALYIFTVYKQFDLITVETNLCLCQRLNINVHKCLSQVRTKVKDES